MENQPTQLAKIRLSKASALILASFISCPLKDEIKLKGDEDEKNEELLLFYTDLGPIFELSILDGKEEKVTVDVTGVIELIYEVCLLTESEGGESSLPLPNNYEENVYFTIFWSQEFVEFIVSKMPEDPEGDEKEEEAEANEAVAHNIFSGIILIPCEIRVFPDLWDGIPSAEGNEKQ